VYIQVLESWGKLFLPIDYFLYPFSSWLSLSVLKKERDFSCSFTFPSAYHDFISPQTLSDSALLVQTDTGHK
jgi:hypothetical protein